MEQIVRKLSEKQTQVLGWTATCMSVRCIAYIPQIMNNLARKQRRLHSTTCCRIELLIMGVLWTLQARP